MSAMPKVTKKQLIRMIDELEKNPNDKVRILGDTGITITGTVLGAAAAGTLAMSAGATSILGLSTAASWFGVSVVAATPVGWIIGCAAAGGAMAYGVSRMIHGGGLSEGRKLELLQKYREDTRNMEAKERSGNIDDAERTRFILSMRELIDKDAISPDKAFRLIEQVEQGRILISQASAFIQALLQERRL
ncbi:hypothetical protein [Nitrosomonas sp. Nm58]|uniref:hypothetical protein n=1 Tax=Nitrosomonas sp. Nm58 TaxID=200126 RepID=UPI0008966CDB|nr:hypothetical protein [Nitrosomonas sp. Nm58]SDZ14244.1 hypothetical protein SAMN05421754_10726 [Nitrosomonas sp. Nm58]